MFLASCPNDNTHRRKVKKNQAILRADLEMRNRDFKIEIEAKSFQRVGEKNGGGFLRILLSPIQDFRFCSK